MTYMEVTIFTSRVYLVVGLLALVFFLTVTLIKAYKKKDYRDYLGLAVFAAIIVIAAKLNLFVPII